MTKVGNHNQHRKMKYQQHFSKIAEKTSKGKTNKKKKRGR